MSLADFEQHPVWIGVHNVDQSEWWYEETDEATFRPWTGSLPVSPEGRDLRVRATVELPDGSRYEGYVCPVPLNWATPPDPRFAALVRMGGEHALMGNQRPAIFIDNKRFNFWGGIGGISLTERQAFYSAVGLPAEMVFPLSFAAKPGLATGIVEGTVLGFYQLVKKDGTLVGQIENDEALEPAGLSQPECNSGKCDEAASSDNHLTAEPPPVDRSPTSRYAAYLRTALPETIRKLESDPSNRRLHLDACLIQFQLQDYEGCLAYSDRGLAADGGYWATRAMESDDLTFLGARALFELGRYQDALGRLTPLWPDHATIWGDATLMTKKALAKACKAAISLQKKELKKRN
jgi:hypothetical protein